MGMYVGRRRDRGDGVRDRYSRWDVCFLLFTDRKRGGILDTVRNLGG